MNFRRIRAIARKELLHIMRDPRSLTMALAVPLMMLLLFGYALTLDVDRIPTMIYDVDQTPESRELIAQIPGSRYFDVMGYVNDYRAIERAIDRDTVPAGQSRSSGFLTQSLAGPAGARCKCCWTGAIPTRPLSRKGYTER